MYLFNQRGPKNWSKYPILLWNTLYTYYKSISFINLNYLGLYNMSGNMGTPAGHNLSGLQSAPNLFSSPGQLGAGAAIFSGGSGAGGQIPGSGQANQQHTPSFANWN